MALLLCSSWDKMATIYDFPEKKFDRNYVDFSSRANLTLTFLNFFLLVECPLSADLLSCVESSSSAATKRCFRLHSRSLTSE